MDMRFLIGILTMSLAMTVFSADAGSKKDSKNMTSEEFFMPDSAKNEKEKAKKETGKGTKQFLPRIHYFFDDSIVGEHLSLGIFHHEAACDYGCAGAGQGPVMLLGEGNGYKKIFTGWSVWASMGALDVGPVLYHSDDKTKIGVAAYLKYVFMQFNVTAVDDEIRLHYGIGI